MEAKREKQTTTMRRRLRRAPLVLLDLALFGTMLIGLGALNRLHDFGARGHWIKYVLDIVSSWSNSLGFGQLGFIGVIAVIAVSAWLCFTLAHYLFAEDSFTNTLPWQQNEVNTRAIPNIAAEVFPMVPYYQRIPRDTSGVVFRSVQWVCNPAGWIVTLSNFIRLEILSVINRALDYFHIPGASAGRRFRMVMSGFFSLILLLPLRGLERLINAPSDMMRYFYSCLPSPRRSRKITSDYTRLHNPPLAIVYQGDAPLPEGSYGATENRSHIPPDFECRMGDDVMPQALWKGKNGQLQSHPPTTEVSTDVKYEQTPTDKAEIIEVTMRGEDGTEQGNGRYKRTQSSPALSYMSQQHSQNMEEQRLQEASKQIAEAEAKKKKEREELRLALGQNNLDRTEISDMLAAQAHQTEAQAKQTEAQAKQAEAQAEERKSMQAQLKFLMERERQRESAGPTNEPAPPVDPSEAKNLAAPFATTPPMPSSVATPASSLAAPAAAFFPSAGNDGGGAAAAEVGPPLAAPPVAQAPTPEPFS